MGCGFALPSAVPVRDLEPGPDGLVLEPVRGETAGVSWTWGVYRNGDDVCTYHVEGAVVQGPACGPPPADTRFGPLTAGGSLANEWTQVSGIVSSDVATIIVVMRDGSRVAVGTHPIDEVGVNARGFFHPLEPGTEASGIVALDERGEALDRFEFQPPEPTPQPAP